MDMSDQVHASASSIPYTLYPSPELPMLIGKEVGWVLGGVSKINATGFGLWRKSNPGRPSPSQSLLIYTAHDIGRHKVI